jgi:hypothetical protein
VLEMKEITPPCEIEEPTKFSNYLGKTHGPRLPLAARLLQEPMLLTTARLKIEQNRSVIIEFVQNITVEPKEILASPLCEIKKIRIWLNAFIPRHVQGLTREVPTLDPTMAGKTMFDTILGCGLTDQRSFSPDLKASSRMHSSAVIDLDADPRTWKQFHRIHPSVQVNCLILLCQTKNTCIRSCG